jgi:hypothetical protein
LRTDHQGEPIITLVIVPSRSLQQMRDSRLVADIICPHLAASLAEKQALLATLDPVARLSQSGKPA